MPTTQLIADHLLCTARTAAALMSSVAAATSLAPKDTRPNLTACPKGRFACAAGYGHDWCVHGLASLHETLNDIVCHRCMTAPADLSVLHLFQ